MPGESRYIVGQQFVTEEKREFARSLRRAMTPQEERVWAAVRSRKLGGYKFRRQQPIDGYIADFYCAEAGVVLELDGIIHEQQADYDAHRDRVIASRRVVVIRLANDRIDGEFERVMGEILTACRAGLG